MEQRNAEKKIRPEEKRGLANRLARIEGQLRGVRRMLEEDADCIAILTQLSAAEAATHSLSMLVLKEEITAYAKEELPGEEDSAIEELCQIIRRYTK